MKFRVILADPPWTYKCWSKKGEGRTASSHYNTMSLEEIKSVPVDKIADKDCVLLLWGTWPNLIDAIEVIDAWGFTYKTVAFLWVKLNRKSIGLHTGLGYWTRANTEYCLLSTRGSPKRKAKDVGQVIMSEIGIHSAKPMEQYNRIERLLDGPYIELFARKRRNGWVSIGYDIDGKDITDAIMDIQAKG